MENVAMVNDNPLKKVLGDKIYSSGCC